MKTIKLTFMHFGRRSQRGQAIVGGTAMMILITILGTGVLMLLLYWAILSNDYQRITGIASSAARELAAARYTLGMERPEWDPILAHRDAIQAVDDQLSMLGYYAQNVSISYNPPGTDTTIPGRDPNTYLKEPKGIPIAVVQMEFDVVPNGFDVLGPKGLLFLIPPHVSGVAFDSESGIRRHAMSTMVFRDPKDPTNARGIRVPIYNYTRLQNSASRPNMLKAGRSVGDFPTAVLRIQAPVSGFFLRDKSGAPGQNGQYTGLNGY